MYALPLPGFLILTQSHDRSWLGQLKSMMYLLISSTNSILPISKEVSVKRNLLVVSQQVFAPNISID